MMVHESTYSIMYDRDSKHISCLVIVVFRAPNTLELAETLRQIIRLYI